MSNANMFFGNAMTAFLLAKQNKEEKAMRDEEIKYRTKLYEIELRKAQQAEASSAKTETQQKEQKLDRSMVLSDTLDTMVSGPNEGKSLSDAIASSQARDSMLMHGIDPKMFGIEPEPTDIRELRLLQQNPDLAALDQSRRAASGTKISLGTGETKFGTPAPGTMITMTPDGPRMEFVPGQGNPAAIEQAQSAEKVANRNQQILTNASNVQTAISDALALVNPLTTGFAGAKMSEIEGTDAFTLVKTIGTIKSNLGIDAITQMRANSPTGGALGNTSNVELDGLQSTVAALDVGLKPEALIKNLKKIQTHYNNWVRIVTQARSASPGLGTTPPALGAQPNVVDFGSLPP